MTQFDEIQLKYRFDVNLNSKNENGKFENFDIFSNSKYFPLKFRRNHENYFFAWKENMVRGSILLLATTWAELLSTLTTQQSSLCCPFKHKTQRGFIFKLRWCHKKFKKSLKKLQKTQHCHLLASYIILLSIII